MGGELTMGTFIEHPEVIGGCLEAVWRPFRGRLEAEEAYRGQLAKKCVKSNLSQAVHSLCTLPARSLYRAIAL